jgi:hypothetical protein
LQALASYYAPNLTWKRRNLPKELLAFILETLDVTKIKPPGFVENPSKFRRLMCKPSRKSNPLRDDGSDAAEVAATERDLERRLSKTRL